MCACGCTYMSLNVCVTPCECGLVCWGVGVVAPPPVPCSPVAPWMPRFPCGPSAICCVSVVHTWHSPTMCAYMLMAWVAPHLLTSIYVSSPLWICVCRLHPGQPLQKGLLPEAVGGSGHVCLAIWIPHDSRADNDLPRRHSPIST